MFETNQEKFMIRECRLSDWVRLTAVADAINRRARQDKTFHPYYAFQLSPEEQDYELNLKEKTKAYLIKALQEQQQSPRSTYRMALCDKQNKLIGNIVVDMLPVRGNDGQVMYGDLGYFIAPEEGGKGLVVDAARFVLNTYFRFHQRLDMTVHPNNIPSRRVMEKLNAHQVSLIHNSHYNNEPRLLYLLTKEAFEAGLAPQKILPAQSVSPVKEQRQHV